MNERVWIAQANTTPVQNPTPPKVVTVVKPGSEQAITIDLGFDQKTKIDLSAVANEKMTMVHVGTKLIVLFDNHSTVTIEPFFDSTGKPLANLDVDLGAGRDVTGDQFASLFPITEDQSVLPAAGGAGAPASGADFHSPSIDPLASGTPLALLGQESLGTWQSIAPLGAPTQQDLGPTVSGSYGSVLILEADLDKTQDGSDLAAGLTTGTDPSGTRETAVLSGVTFTAGSQPIDVTFGNTSGVTVTEGGNIIHLFWVASPDGTHLDGYLVDPSTPGAKPAIELQLIDPATNSNHVGANGTINPVVTVTLTDAFPHSVSGHDVIVINGVPVVATDSTVGSNGLRQSVTTTLEIDIVDDTPVSTGAQTAAPTLDDDGFAHGNPKGAGDVPDANEAHGGAGALFDAGADGFKSVTLDSVTAFKAIYVDNNGVAHQEVVTHGAGVVNPDGSTTWTFTTSDIGTVATLTIGADGSYDFKTNAPLVHPTPGTTEETLALTFSYTVTDGDGDTAPGSLTVNVNDDTPVLNTAPVAVYHADEGDIITPQSVGTSPDDGHADGSTTGPLDIAGPATVTGSVLSAVDFGADGEGGFSFTSDALSTLQNLGLTSNSGTLHYAMVGNTLVAYVDTAFGGYQPGLDRTVFTLSLNHISGDFEFRLYDQLDHVDDGLNAKNTDLQGAHGIVSGLDFGSLIVATDGDGDAVTLDGKLTIEITDDIPKIIAFGETGATVTVDETAGRQANDTTSGLIAYRFNDVAHVGHDPNMAAQYAFNLAPVVASAYLSGADDSAHALLSLTINGVPGQGEPGVDSGLTTTEGATIYLVMENGLIIGRIDGNNDGKFDGSADDVAAFAISINQFGQISVAQYLSIHNNVAGDNNDTMTLGGTISAQLKVTDHDGDTVTQSVVIGTDIHFNDDGPSASDYTGGNYAEGSSLQIIGAAMDVLHINPGADGLAAGGLQSITFSAGNHGGSLSIDNNGNLVYAPPADVISSATVTETFTYTVTDGDGDTVTRTIKFGVTDVGVSNVAVSNNAIVDEDDIQPIGNNDHAPGDEDQVTTGHISYTLGPDGLQSVVLSADTSGITKLDGTAIHTIWDAASQTLIGYGGAVVTDVNDVTDKVFTIAVTDATNSGADYQVTLLQPILHPGHSDPSNPASPLTSYEDDKTFLVTVTVNDNDGSEGTANFNVSVNDDSPVVPGPGGYVGSVTVSEHSDPVTGNFAEQTASGVMTFRGGADGARITALHYGPMNGTTARVYDADAGNSPVVRLDLTSGGKPVIVDEVAGPNGPMLVGHLGDGTEIFILEVTDAATGAYTFKQLGPIDQPDHNESGTADPVRMDISFTVTDGDGDTATGHIHVDINDDAPQAFYSNRLTLQESTNSNGAFQEQTASGHFVFNGGADGATVTSVDYGFAAGKVNDPDAPTGPGIPFPLVSLTSNGQAITFSHLNGDPLTLVGIRADATVVFELKVTNAATGAYDFTQFAAIDQPDHNESGTADPLRLKFTFTVTDGDGDTATNSNQIDILDDSPHPVIATTNVTLSIDETAGDQSGTGDFLGAGNTPIPAVFAGITSSYGAPIEIAQSSGAVVSSSGSSYGADGAGATPPVYALSVAPGGVDSGLTATDGNKIYLFDAGNGVVVGRESSSGSPDSNGAIAFAIAIDSATGVVTVAEYTAIHQNNTNDPNDSISIADGVLQATVTLTDFDGDQVTSAPVSIGGQIKFFDDGPSIAPPSENLIVNGSFEIGTGLGNGQWSIYHHVDGWDAGSDGVPFELQNNASVPAQDGSIIVELDSDPNSTGHTNATIQQTVTTQAGQVYQLTFWYAARPGEADGSGDMNVLWNGNSVQAIHSTGVTVGVWQQYTIFVTGTGHDTLAFQAGGAEDSLGALLDNVSLVPLATVDEDGLRVVAGDAVTGNHDSQPGDVTVPDNDRPNGTGDGNEATVTGHLNINWGADNYDGVDSYNDSTGFTQDGVGRSVTFTDNQVGIIGGALSSHGDAIVFSLENNGTKLVGTATHNGIERTVIEVTLSDEGTGAFHVILHDALDQTAGSNENNIILTFNYTATDSDGDHVAGRFSVAVNDDVPVRTDHGPVTGSVNEADMSSGTTVSSSHTLDFSSTGLNATHLHASGGDGVEVVTFYNPYNSNLQGPDSATGARDLILTADSGTTFTLGNIAIGWFGTPVGSVPLTLTAYDAAGSKVAEAPFTAQSVAYVSAIIPASSVFAGFGNIEISKLVIETPTGYAGRVVIDNLAITETTTTIPTTPHAVETVVDLAPLVSMGADSPGTWSVTPFAPQQLQFTQGGSVDPATYNGTPIMISISPSDAHTIIGTAGGVEIFTMTLSENGQATFELLKPIDGGTLRSIDFSQFVTVTDSDGDPLTLGSGDFVINISSAADHQPTVSADMISVNEAGLPTGSSHDGSNTQPGSIVINPGDGPSTVTIDGVAITAVGQIFQSQTGLGTLTIIGITATEITYSYTLNTTTSGDNTHDSFSVAVTDSDHETSTTTLTVNIVDDVPSALGDTDTVRTGLQTLTFDDIPLVQGQEGPISHYLNYGGFIFQQTGVYDPSGTGSYVPTSGDNLAFIGEKAGTNIDGYAGNPGDPIVISKANGELFAPQSLNLSSNSADPLSVVIVGYDSNGNVTGTITVTDVHRGSATAVDLSGLGLVDHITLDSPGGANNLYFGFDDFSYIDIHGSTTGNVITGLGTDSGAAGADVLGADGAHVTAVSFGGTTVSAADANGNLTIHGDYGTLTINADGTYTYTRAAGSGGGHSDVFTYTLTDNDNDPSAATLTIGVADSAPTIGAIPAAGDEHAIVYEAGLAARNGNEPAGSDGGKSVTADGTIAFTSVDGVSAVTLGGHALTTSSTTFIDAAGVGAMSAYYIYNVATGQGAIHYSYTLTDNTSGDHTAAIFAVVVTDADNDDTSAGNLVINIVNDAPVANHVTAAMSENDSTTVTLQEGTDFLYGADGATLTLGAVSVDGAYVPSSLSGLVTLNGTDIVINPGTMFDPLNAGQSSTIHIPYSVTDSDGDVRSSEVTVTVNGANDTAVISGNDHGSVTEDGQLLANGALAITDVDAGQNHFQTVSSSALAGVYGAFTFDTHSGAWTYTLDNGNPIVQALNTGDTKQDVLVVTSADGLTSHTITVDIHGTNDAPVLPTPHNDGILTNVSQGGILMIPVEALLANDGVTTGSHVSVHLLSGGATFDSTGEFVIFTSPASSSSFTYQLIDNLDHSDPATVTVTRISNPLVGGVGEDFFIPRNWDEQVNGSGGQDILIAQNNGNYHLNGGDGNDVLFGGLSGHFSHLNGGAGDDILYAGGPNGTTEMTGGTGADTFVFKDYSFGWYIGSITDYNSSEGDRVDISDLLQGYNSNTPVSNWVKFENGLLSVNQDGVGSDFVTIVSFTNHPDHLQVLLNATQAPVTV